MYLLVGQSYPVADMVHFDGECLYTWIDLELRKAARDAGYDIQVSVEDEADFPWADKLQTRIRFDNTNDDNLPVYRAWLSSGKILTSTDGTVTYEIDYNGARYIA